MSGFQWKTQGSFAQDAILIDQGGGSTELSAFTQNFQLLHFPTSTHIPLGTTSIIEYIFQQNTKETQTQKAFTSIANHTQKHIEQATRPLQNRSWGALIGVGSALTNATKKKGNRKQHGLILKKQYLQKRHAQLQKHISLQYSTLQDLQQSLQRGHDNKDYSLQENLVSFVGLGMITNIMTRLGFQSIIINGVGLRYGICYEYIKQLYPKWHENTEQYQKLFLLNANRIGHLIEGTWVEGIVENIHPRHGVFVQLGGGYSGLIHMRRFYARQKKPHQLLKKKQTIRVYIEKIHMGDKPKFTLTLWK